MFSEDQSQTFDIKGLINVEPLLFLSGKDLICMSYLDQTTALFVLIITTTFLMPCCTDCKNIFRL